MLRPTQIQAYLDFPDLKIVAETCAIERSICFHTV